jgi:predicted O-linked N-acetylglucosamine transferase (SPINDLY family)
MLSLKNVRLAKQSIQTALSLEPNSEEAKQQLMEITNFENISIKPLISPNLDSISTLTLSGLRAQEQGDISAAETLFKSALNKNPDEYFALYSLAVIKSTQDDLDASIELLQRAVSVRPNCAEALFALGTSQMSKGLWEASLNNLNMALALNPYYEEARVNQSNLLHSMRRPKEALLTLNIGLEKTPNSQKLLNNKGYILSEIKQYSSAADTFEKLLNLNSKYENALGLLAHAKLHACDWTNLPILKDEIIKEVSSGAAVIQPFALMSLTDDPQIIRNCAKIFGKQKFPPKARDLWKGEKYRHRKKRIAFLSADFREHAVGYLFREILARIDPLRFETLAVHSGVNDGSDVYCYYKTKFDHYISAESKTSLELAEILKVFETDIAIDLSGYTSGSRLDVLSHRPAPIQISYLGYPGTLVLPYIDYLISDNVTIPESEAHHYSERILRLDSCYLPTFKRRLDKNFIKSKSEYGLPENSIIFCSFNHDYKINEPIFNAWMSLLDQHQNSCLWLMKLNEDAQRNLKCKAANYGIAPERLVFATRVKTLDEHLARYAHADLCLDTFPYNGHTTTFDALSMGVNVVSISGRAFQSRVAASLLTDYGQTQNISANLIEYQEKAKQALELKQTGNNSTPVLAVNATAESKGESFNSILASLSPHC